MFGLICFLIVFLWLYDNCVQLVWAPVNGAEHEIFTVMNGIPVEKTNQKPEVHKYIKVLQKDIKFNFHKLKTNIWIQQYS